VLKVGKRYLQLKQSSYIELQFLYGIGVRISVALCSYLGMRNEYVLLDIPTSHIILRSLSEFFSKIEYYLEFFLKRVTNNNLWLLRKLYTYRGVRYFRGFPTRGQRRRTNARTVRRLLLLHK